MLVNPISALYPSSGGLQFRLHSRDKSFENSTCIRRVFLCTFDILMCYSGVTTPNFGEIKGRHLTSAKRWLLQVGFHCKFLTAPIKNSARNSCLYNHIFAEVMCIPFISPTLGVLRPFSDTLKCPK